MGCLRENLNIPTNCCLCNDEQEDDEKHAFLTCPSSKYAWATFNKKAFFSSYLNFLVRN